MNRLVQINRLHACHILTFDKKEETTLAGMKNLGFIFNEMKHARIAFAEKFALWQKFVAISVFCKAFIEKFGHFFHFLGGYAEKSKEGGACNFGPAPPHQIYLSSIIYGIKWS